MLSCFSNQIQVPNLRRKRDRVVSLNPPGKVSILNSRHVSNH